MDKMSLIALAKASKAGGGGGSFTQEQADWNQTDNTQVDFIKNKPSLSTVATSGSYNDLNNQPDFATVATSGSYNDLSDKPDIPTVPTVDTALDPTSTNAVQNRAIAHELAGGNTQASGDVITISDGSNLALTSATSTLAPIQDLHGYSSPWVGGAGKNLVESKISGYYLTAQGTLSPNPNYDVQLAKIKEGVTYTVTTDATELVCGFYTSLPTSESVTYDNSRIVQAGYTFTAPIDGYAGFRSTSTDTTPQLEQGNQATSYAPYSNICPISGYDSASITILDDSTKKQYLEGLLNGTYGFVDLGTLTWSYMESGSVVAPYFATTGVTNCKSYGNPSSNSINAICTDYKVTKRNVSDFVNGCLCGDGTDTTVTVIEIKDSNYTDATVFKNALSGIYLIYELATPTTTTITSEQYETLAKAFGGQGVIVEFGNTIYSGVIDWCTGVVTVDKAMVDLGTLTWGANLSLNIFYAYVNGMKQPTTQAQRNQGIISSNYYASTTTVIDATMPNGTMLKNNSSIYIKDVSYNSVANFETAMDGVQFCYELATPTTIQLTPTQLKTLAGYNTIYTDVGNISIAYQPNNVIAECKEYTDNAIPTVDNALDDTSLNPIANKPVAEAIADIDSNIEGSKQLTTTGNVITVSDSAATYLEELEVEVEPIQDLSNGDPSPTNICPISGYDEVSVETTDEEETTTNTITATFDNTVYSGHVDFTNGVVTVDMGYIASYNGETLTGAWISDRDVYTSGGTPTTGAEVVYELATPQTIQLTPQQLQMLKGYNTVITDANGGMTIKYQPDNVIGELKKEIQEVDDKIPTTPFDGKKVLFIGDSFMEGFGARVADGLETTSNPITTPAVADSTPMRGWAKTFQERYPKAIVHNISIYGATIAYQNNAPSVMGQLTYIATNSIGGEYVVLDGGANDVFQGIIKGSAKADDVYEEMNWNTMNYNTYQTIPCLEAIFAIFAEHYPTVRLLYVSPPPMDVTLTEEMQTAMDTMNTEIEALCEKWGVKYIKIIGKGSKNTIYSNNTEYYTASDKIHPLQRFYDETIGQIDEVLKQF